MLYCVTIIVLFITDVKKTKQKTYFYILFLHKDKKGEHNALLTLLCL